MRCEGLDLIFWHIVRDDIQRALDHNGRMSVDQLYELIESRDAQLWVCYDNKIRAVATTEIVKYPSMKVVRSITLTGENMDDWLDVFIDTVSAWAKELGCEGIETGGRMGWKKVLQKRGFENPQIFMTKKL